MNLGFNLTADVVLGLSGFLIFCTLFFFHFLKEIFLKIFPCFRICLIHKRVAQVIFNPMRVKRVLSWKEYELFWCELEDQIAEKEK